MKKNILAIWVGLALSVNAFASIEPSKELLNSKDTPFLKNMDSEPKNPSVEPEIYKLITDDNYLLLIQSRLAEVEQKPYVESVIGSILPSVINQYNDMAEKKFQLIEFFDFNCSYCRDAIEMIYAKMADMQDVGLSYVVLLSDNSEETLTYASFGLTKIPPEKQKTYLLTMFELLNRNTVTLEQVKTELAKYKIEPTEDEIKVFLKSQSELTNKVYLEMRLHGTPTFVMLPTVNIEKRPVEVILGTQAIPYLELYKLKLSARAVKLRHSGHGYKAQM